MQFLLAALAIASGSWIYIPGGTWTPGPKTVAAIRADLKAAVLRQAGLEHEQLPAWGKYSFQYQGRELEGRRIVYVNGFCVAPDYADKYMVMVADGGPCFFFAIYDVGTKSFATVQFNGRG